MATKRQDGKIKKSTLREWFDSVLFAVMAATLIRWLFFSAFLSPSSSMEHSLLVGDYLFVSRLHYGTTTPVTPLQVPLTHQTIWGTDIPSYLDWIKLPQFRLPGFSDIRRGDVVVFNLPAEHPDLFRKYEQVLPNLHPHPVDLRTNYIKRCVGIPGDRLEIKNGQVFVNGKAEDNPENMQSEYFVSTGVPVNQLNVFKKNGITEFTPYTETFNDSLPANDEYGYIVKTTANRANRLKRYDFVKRLEPVLMQNNVKEPHLFPSSDHIVWNRDQYGPVTVPGKGITIEITNENLAVYTDIILSYEGNADLTLKGDTLMQNGKAVTDYTFKKDYYFMMGDNRHNSADSRYWGFVPKDHVVGKAILVWMSVDPEPTNFLNKIRWDRIFKIIR